MSGEVSLTPEVIDVPKCPSPNGMETSAEETNDEQTRPESASPVTLPEDNFFLLKNSLVSPNETEFDSLRLHLLQKLDIGGGETILEIGAGVDDSVTGLPPDDFNASVATLQALTQEINADCVVLRQKNGSGGTKANPFVIAQYLVRRRADTSDFMEVRVAVVGNVDAGKSTLLGVLTHGELDNGRGFARMKLFRHKHEMESGRTSSVGNDILGFDSTGKVVNKPDHGHLDWVKICKDSSKVITFIDLAGHERYLKTTVFGMTGHLPDFTMLMVGANAGIVGMTKEHLGLALALNVPVMVVVTKIDMCPPNVMQETLKLLHKILKSAGCRKVPLLIRNADDVVVAATNFVSERLCPIFQVSNVEGTNLHLLTMFLNLLSTPRTGVDDQQPPHFQIDDTYQVPGVGVVVSGTCIKGLIRVNDTLLLGPTNVGDFIPMPIKSIHRKRMPVREVRGGQTASFALKKIKINEVRKGQVLVHPSMQPTSCWEFKGEILVLHHPTTISTKYQAMVHVGPVRQTASIIDMDKDCLRTGDKATVHFKFIKHPEYLQPGLKMVFREGRTKAVGKVLEVIPKTANMQQMHKTNKIMKNLKQTTSSSIAQNSTTNTKHKDPANTTTEPLLTDPASNTSTPHPSTSHDDIAAEESSQNTASCSSSHVSPPSTLTTKKSQPSNYVLTKQKNRRGGRNRSKQAKQNSSNNNNSSNHHHLNPSTSTVDEERPSTPPVVETSQPPGGDGGE